MRDQLGHLLLAQGLELQPLGGAAALPLLVALRDLGQYLIGPEGGDQPPRALRYPEGQGLEAPGIGEVLVFAQKDFRAPAGLRQELAQGLEKPHLAALVELGWGLVGEFGDEAGGLETHPRPELEARRSAQRLPYPAGHRGIGRSCVARPPRKGYVAALVGQELLHQAALAYPSLPRDEQNVLALPCGLEALQGLLPAHQRRSQAGAVHRQGLCSRHLPALADLLGQGLGLGQGLEAQLVAQDLGEPLELAERLLGLPQRRIEAHGLAVRLLLQLVEVDQGLEGLERPPEVALALQLSRLVPQRFGVGAAQPFALVPQPDLELRRVVELEVLKKLSAPKPEGVGAAVALEELLHIQLEAAQADLRPPDLEVRLHRGLAQLIQNLPQVAPPTLLVAFTPQQVYQPRARRAALDRQVGQQRYRLAR
ncbi:hypothetical protein A3962_08905 [Meiothermus taiwanensis]|nr:hypothetical protein A3962_08905 [Meiothermus taiwanensis]